MLKPIFSKVTWIGKATTFVVGLAVVLALILAIVATAAEAAKAKSLNVGVQNTVSAATSMVGSVAGPLLRLDNNSTASGATALDLQVESGKAPMTVNPEAGTATALSADELDGMDSTDFFPGGDLPSGKTIRGSYAIHWTADAASEFQSESIPFGFTLASAPTPHFVAKDATAPTECPGSVNTPEAAPGHLCIYETFSANLFEVRVCDPVADSCPGASRYGAAVVVLSDEAGLAGTLGTWAVTAP